MRTLTLLEKVEEFKKSALLENSTDSTDHLELLLYALGQLEYELDACGGIADMIASYFDGNISNADRVENSILGALNILSRRLYDMSQIYTTEAIKAVYEHANKS